MNDKNKPAGVYVIWRKMFGPLKEALVLVTEGNMKEAMATFAKKSSLSALYYLPVGTYTETKLYYAPQRKDNMPLSVALTVGLDLRNYQFATKEPAKL